MMITYLMLAAAVVTAILTPVFIGYVLRYNRVLTSALHAVIATNNQVKDELILTRVWIARLIDLTVEEEGVKANEAPAAEEEPERQAVVGYEIPAVDDPGLVQLVHHPIIPLDAIPMAVAFDATNFLMTEGLSNHHCAQPSCHEFATHYLQLLLYLNGLDEPDVVITVPVALCLKHVEIPVTQVVHRCWRELASLGLTQLDQSQTMLRAKLLGDSDWVECIQRRAAMECAGRA